MTTPLTRGNKEGILQTVWDALEVAYDNYYQENSDEETWDEICTAMAWIREDLGLSNEVQP